jgi:hypothetical protein
MQAATDPEDPNKWLITPPLSCLQVSNLNKVEGILEELLPVIPN